ncbi:hypothetical protein [Subtercola boreus]|nr:hypothetical protein [Subtercola boreus]
MPSEDSRTDTDYDDDSSNEMGSWSREHPNMEALRAAETEYNEHPGTALVRRLGDLERIFNAWSGFSLSLRKLLEQCENHEPTIVELVIRNVGDTSPRERIRLMLDQATVAYVAGLGALIDHNRIVLKAQSSGLREEYATRLATITETVPGALFLAKLRNYVLHYVVAPWEFSAKQAGETMTAEVLLNAGALLEFRWDAAVQSFIQSGGEQIQLSPLLGPYQKAMHDLTDWFLQRCWNDNAELVAELNNLITKRNLILSGGITDGHDWEKRVGHMQENHLRAERGEPQTDFRTGKPIDKQADREPSAPRGPLS